MSVPILRPSYIVVYIEIRIIIVVLSEKLNRLSMVVNPSLSRAFLPKRWANDTYTSTKWFCFPLPPLPPPPHTFVFMHRQRPPLFN